MPASRIGYSPRAEARGPRRDQPAPPDRITCGRLLSRPELLPKIIEAASVGTSCAIRLLLIWRGGNQTAADTEHDAARESGDDKDLHAQRQLSPNAAQEKFLEAIKPTSTTV